MFRKADPDHVLSRGTTYVRITQAITWVFSVETHPGSCPENQTTDSLDKTAEERRLIRVAVEGAEEEHRRARRGSASVTGPWLRHYGSSGGSARKSRLATATLYGYTPAVSAAGGLEGTYGRSRAFSCLMLPTRFSENPENQ
jgi:hypothetical protein